MKEVYLRKEPMHWQEVKRQTELLEKGMILWEGEAIWHDEGGVGSR